MAFEAGNKIKVKTYGGKKNRLSENKKETKKKMKRREEKKTPLLPKLSLSMRRHNKTYVYHLFQYCDCYYGDEGTD